MESLSHTPWKIGEQLKVPLREYNFSVKGSSIIALECYAPVLTDIMNQCNVNSLFH